MDNQSHDELEIGRRQSGFPGKAGDSDAIAGLQKAAADREKEAVLPALTVRRSHKIIPEV